jgi:hypothetical protein
MGAMMQVGDNIHTLCFGSPFLSAAADCLWLCSSVLIHTLLVLCISLQLLAMPQPRQPLQLIIET